MALADRAQKGLILKQAREAKGISLEAVQDATKIPLDSLKAIEEGYRVRTMTDFYYRAFVKL
ncbi:MAG TPA: helix-turn-helix domain-containing protein, partial [Candidatus Omnitrophota bacterium]|nr:helix-turn-helix domain-containing protein [Candidatus Omnitrophota bacterium]